MFTQRHYNAIAKTLSGLSNSSNKAYIIDRLSRMFELDNERFIQAKFQEACKGANNG